MDKLIQKEEINKSFDRLKWVFRQLKLESSYGKNALRNIKPYKPGQETELNKSFCYLQSIVSKIKKNNNLFASFNRLFMELRNIAGSVKNLLNNNILGETELFEIKNFAIIVAEILDLAKENDILPDNLSNIDLKPAIRLLNPDQIVTRSFYIHESWSEKLQSIREQKQSIETKIVSTNDIDAKNKYREERLILVNQEKDEEQIVRKALTNKLKEYETILDYSVKNIGSFELELAKAELAATHNCSVPTIFESESNNQIRIENAVEPEIAESLKGFNRSFTPVSLELQKGVTLLTGANMGGKSVALKTIALNVELIRFGFLPFAEKIALKIPDFIEFISGDLQDSHLGLSSFGAEIKALSVLLSKTKGNSGLVLCDELGRSTNPYEGSRFVLALSDWLQSSSSYAIIATHYDGIKTKGAAYYQVAGLRDLFRNNSENNNKKIFDHKELWQLMDYHLIKVSESSEVPKEALNIGILLGLQEEFLERLRKYYG